MPIQQFMTLQEFFQYGQRFTLLYFEILTPIILIAATIIILSQRKAKKAAAARDLEQEKEEVTKR